MGDHDLRTTLGAVPIERDVVEVRGLDAVAFLQGQLSQEVADLAPGSSTWALLLQPTGKVDAWLRATRLADDALSLDVEAGFGELVRARLARFKLRTAAELDLTRRSGYAVRGPGAATQVTGGLPAGWPGIEGVDLLAEDFDPSIPRVDRTALDGLRIECGVPLMGAEITEATIPAELGQWLIDASVSFTKGCYTGQELVARIDSRGGNVPRPVRGLLVEGDVAPDGSGVVRDGTEVGTVTSAGRSPALGSIALAVVGRSVVDGTSVELRRPDGSVTAGVVAALPMR